MELLAANSQWSFERPWFFCWAIDPLAGSTSTVPVSMTQRSKRSFAELFQSPSAHVPLSDLPDPVVQGNNISVKIDEHVYQQSVKLSNELVLIGRLVMSKGVKPLTLEVVRSKLDAFYGFEKLKVLP